MDIKFITKMQEGGATSLPFATYQALPGPAPRGRAVTSSDNSGSDSSSKKDLTDKDLATLLEKLDGLPSDMAVITNNLKNFYVNNTGSSLLGASTTSNITAQYLDTLNQLKIANFNKKEYDNAFKIVSENGGINEVAINERGQFVCVNSEGDFKFMTAEELKKSKDYRPLTNSELLRFRANDPTLANNNQILSVVQNGISMDKITDQISKIINNLGTDEKSEEGFISSEKSRVIKGLQDFQTAVQEAANGEMTYDGTVDDLYKYKYLTKTQANQAANAMNYIYNTLTPNAKALLKSKTDLTDEGAKKLIQTLIASKIDTTNHFEIDKLTGKGSNGSKSSSGKDDTDLKSTQLLEMVTSNGGVETDITIDRGDGIQMSVTGRAFNVVNDTQGNPIEQTSLAHMMAASGIQGIVKNMQGIVFGDQKLKPEELKNITYNNTGVVRAELPKKADGSINLDVLENFKKAENEYKLLGKNATAEDKKRIYKKYELDNLLNADGSPNIHTMGVFLVTEGYTTDSLIPIEGSKFLKEFRGDSEKAAEIIKQSLKEGTGKEAVKPEVDTFSWWNPLDWISYDKIYKAAIYIPIDNNQQNAARLDGQKIDYDEALESERKYQNFGKGIQGNNTFEPQQ